MQWSINMVCAISKHSILTIFQNFQVLTNGVIIPTMFNDYKNYKHCQDIVNMVMIFTHNNPHLWVQTTFLSHWFLTNPVRTAQLVAR